MAIHAIVKQIAEQLKGRLSIDEEKGILQLISIQYFNRWAHEPCQNIYRPKRQKRIYP